MSGDEQDERDGRATRMSPMSPMSPMSRTTVERLRLRLLSIEWVDDYQESKARVALTREFLRRASAWALLPGAAVERFPFFDAAARVDPAVRAPQHLVDEATAAVPVYQGHVRRLCAAALHMAALIDAAGAGVVTGAAVPGGLLEPYAPLIRSFELGGGFARECAGMFEIGEAAMFFQEAGFYAGKPAPSGLPEFPDLAGDRT